MASRRDLEQWLEMIARLETTACNRWRLTNHMLKWAVQTGRVPMIVFYRENPQKWNDEKNRVLALIMGREPEEVTREAEIYVDQCGRSEKLRAALDDQV